jgi:Ser/Thr protein kinase RdoA (MazF antagonist)
LSGVRDWLARLIGELGSDSLLLRLDALTPTVFESALPAQALHGDVSLSNLLPTGRGLLWNDLEDVCCGPVEWDLAGLVSSARARGPAFVEELLAGYGGPGLDDLEPFLEAHALYEAVWRARA